MQRFLSGVVVVLCFLLASSAGYAAGQDAPEGKASDEIVPREDGHVRLLIYDAVDHGPRAKGAPEAIETLLAMDREKLLSALAYQMSTKDYRVCSVMFMGKYLPEKRLVPFLVRVIQEANGRTLMEAVKTAQAIPDPRLLAPIFDRALESDYEERIYLPAPIGREVIRKPLFGEAAKAIHVITGGAVGIKDVPYEEKLRSIKQEKLPQWRQWWQENKTNWPAAPPLPEKPKEPASPGKNTSEKGAPAGSDAQEPPKNAPEPAKVTEPVGKSAPQDKDEEIWRLLLRAVAPAKPEITQAAAQELLAMDRERFLAALGRFVQRKDRAPTVMNFVRGYFMDKQAVPLVAEALRQADGPALRQAVLIARLMPDPAFVGPLIEHALSSGYRTTALAATPQGSQEMSISAFAQATLTLHALTKGKSGIKPVSAREETKEKKEALIAQWREWWQTNKDTWQAQPPGNEKPKENPSPPKADPPKEPPPPPAETPPKGTP